MNDVSSAMGGNGTEIIGRTGELARLCGKLQDARTGHGGLCLVAGATGIGKTRLARELAERAAGDSFDVLWATCDDSPAAPAYHPWIDILRALLALRGGLAGTKPYGPFDLLVGSSPALAETAESPAVPASTLEAERLRFELFDAVARALRVAATERSLVVVLDDAHTADVGSLLLLRHAAHALHHSRVLMVATVRAAESRLAQHGQAVLADLADVSETVLLDGWDLDELRSFLRPEFPEGVPARLLEVVYQLTRGNPLFVEGVSRTLRERGDVVLADGFPLEVRLPDGLRTVLRGRLDPLSGEARKVLECIAVAGRHGAVPLVAEIAAMELAAVVDHANEAVGARVLLAPERVGGVYRFAHPLIREIVHADLPGTRRQALHRRAAIAIQQAQAPALDEHASAIAHHYIESSSRGDADAAVAFARKAAEWATARCAYEEAAHQVRRALATLPDDDVEERCALLVALGEAHLRAGHVARAHEICREASQLARELGAAELLARATLARSGEAVAPGGADPEVVGHLEESLRLLPSDAHATRALVGARLALALNTPSAAARRASVCRGAVDDARRSGRDDVLAQALDARHRALWDQSDLVGQVETAAMMTAAARACGNRELELQSLQLRLVDALELGDIGAAEHTIEEYARLASEFRQAPYELRLRLFRATCALVDGDLAGAEGLVEEAHQVGSAAVPVAAHALAIARLRGPHEAVRSRLHDFVGAYPVATLPRIGLAALHADADRRDAAAAAFERIAARDFVDVARDGEWLVCMSLAGDVCAYLGDRRRAERLVELLRPFAGRVAVSHANASCHGSVSRPLGSLMALLGRWEEARGCFEGAIEVDARLRAPIFVARDQLGLANVIVCSGGELGAVARAVELAREAELAATRLGAAGVVAAATRLAAALEAGALLRKG